MAKNDSGKWVSRAAATGGGRTYRSQRPTNYYLALTLVVVLGLLSIAISRHSYRSTSNTATGAQPAIGKTWYAGYAISVCGTEEPSLAPNASSTTGQTTTGDGVVKITPTAKNNAGKNATIGKFVSGYNGFLVSQASITIPESVAKTYKTGDVCPAGTPDAGKKGVVTVAYWPTVASKSPKDVTTNYANTRWAQNSLVTFSFAPQGAKPMRPASTTISAMLRAGSGAPTTTALTSITVPVSTVPGATGTPSSTPMTTLPVTSTSKP
ncbi:MAG: hypothetical protein WCO31_02260 [Actinomycetes bacterium]